VISAYALVWLIAMFYIWTVWRKVGKLEGELRTLERRKGTPREQQVSEAVATRER
jgi:hypothetical protein